MHRGGGVGFYAKNCHCPKSNTNLTRFREKTFECATIELNINKRKILISNIYRPPSNDINTLGDFFNDFEWLLSQLHRNDCPNYILTDININLLKINYCPTAQKYLDVVHENGFLNGILKATRIFGNNFSLIDHILCKNVPTNSRFGVVVNDISDHFFVFTSFTTTPIKQTTKHIKTRDFSFDKMSEFRQTLTLINTT